MQALSPQLPPGLRAELIAIAAAPLRVLLQRLLSRLPAPPAASPGVTSEGAASSAQPSLLLADVLAAYMAAVVLPLPPGPRQAGAEGHLLASLSGRLQATAVQAALTAAAQQAAGAAATALQRSAGDVHGTGLAAEERRQLLQEALQELTSSAGLEAAAAAQLLAQRAEQQVEAQQQQEQQQRGSADAANVATQQDGQPEEAADNVLAALLHSPPTQVEIELLCLVALLPDWEGTMRRLADLQDDTLQPASSGGSSSTACITAGGAAAQQAVQLLCDAAAGQLDALVAVHPALPAEVCRRSFRFTCAWGALLARQQRAAADGTRPAAEVARWRVAHAAKHADHVSDYLRSLGCTL